VCVQDHADEDPELDFDEDCVAGSNIQHFRREVCVCVCVWESVCVHFFHSGTINYFYTFVHHVFANPVLIPDRKFWMKDTLAKNNTG